MLVEHGKHELGHDKGRIRTIRPSDEAERNGDTSDGNPDKYRQQESAEIV
jgi:hypothetical protein